MGYTTNFEGKLEFKNSITTVDLAYLNQFMGEDIRDHKNWDLHDFPEGVFHIDLAITKEFGGIEWNGSEKTYGMVEVVNWLTKQMQKVCPNFVLVGQLIAQGEDLEDRWVLNMENGVAVRRDVVITGKIVTCPHCEESFILEGE